MNIGGFDLNKHVLIIAEIGNNHEGDINIAKEMIHAAVSAGVDAVKFQTFIPQHYVSQLDTVRFQQLNRFCLKNDDFILLKNEAQKLGVIFLSTPFDIESAVFLNTIVPAFKVSSGDNTFYPLLKEIAGFCKPILLSRGLADIETIQTTRDLIFNIWKKKRYDENNLAILHCVSRYPVPAPDVQLAAIRQLKEYFGCVVGYSDHFDGIDASVYSVLMGARIIEKHFTIDKNYSAFRDHQISASPKEMKTLVQMVRSAEEFMGTGDLYLKNAGQQDILSFRRSIVSNKKISKGERIGLKDISWVRPGGGLTPGRENEIIGRIASRDIPAWNTLSLEDFL